MSKFWQRVRVMLKAAPTWLTAASGLVILAADPVADNGSAEGRAANRRAEITVR